MHKLRSAMVVTAATLVLGLTACSGSAHKSGAPAAAQSAGSVKSAASLSDADLQAALQQAAVGQTDLPAGWNSSLTMTNAPADAGSYKAVYTALFSQETAGGGGSTSLVVTLMGYQDAKAAGAQFSGSTGKFSLQSAGGQTSFNANAIKLGDAAVATQLSAPTGNLAEIIWRRGPVVAMVLLTQGAGANAQAMDQAITIAKAQDAKLAAAGL